MKRSARQTTMLATAKGLQFNWDIGLTLTCLFWYEALKGKHLK